MKFPFILRRKIKFFTAEESHLVVKAIRHAEHRTSGEVRVFVETRCPFMDAIDRAQEIFFSLKMDKTDQRNAVLVYIAIKDRQLAVFGDQGIHEKVGSEYWLNLVNHLLQSFNHEKFAEGISECAIKIGEALQSHFPYDKDTDKNELPDEIVFGK